MIKMDLLLKSAPVCNHGRNEIKGFEDLGEIGSSHFKADNALAFIVRSLYSKWKQSVSNVLTVGTVKSDTLQGVVRFCLDKLEKISLCTMVLV